MYPAHVHMIVRHAYIYLPPCDQLTLIKTFPDVISIDAHMNNIFVDYTGIKWEDWKFLLQTTNTYITGSFALRLFTPISYIPKSMSIVLKDSSSTKLSILQARLTEMGLEYRGEMRGIEIWRSTNKNNACESWQITQITIRYVPDLSGDTAQCFLCATQLLCIYFNIVRKGLFYSWISDSKMFRYIYHPLIDSIPLWKRMIYRFYLPTSQFSIEFP
jgi:hypothetical protein